MGVPYAEVIGDPIAHSKSPVIHTYWLERLSIVGTYGATHVPPGELHAYLHERSSDPNWRGCNVTIPYKEAALKHVSLLDPTAAAVGAVNCIIPATTGLGGYNSDVDGVAEALRDVALKDRKVAIVGGGGAARAALAYLSKTQVSAINVLVREPGRASKLQSLGDPRRITIGSFADACKLVDGTALIINASPLGMRGCPDMPTSLLAAIRNERDAALFDMVYNPLATAFLSSGNAQRIDGLCMLLGQAARAFELFFGASPPPVDRELRELLLRSE